MSRRFLTLFLLFVACFLLFSCSDSKSGSAETSDSDKLQYNENEGSDSDELEADEESIPDSDLYIPPVTHCEISDDCEEHEVCNPYGECVCARHDGYMLRYKGKCILGVEANKILCSNHSSSFIPRQTTPRRGAIPFVEKSEDIYCLCGFGWAGEACEIPLKEYDDSTTEYVSGKGMMPLLPTPDCHADSECPEGTKCGEDGYCYCPGNITFSSPFLDDAVRKSLMISSSSPIDGRSLAHTIKLNISKADKLEHTQCMRYMRQIVLDDAQSSFDFSQLLKLPYLSYLMIFTAEEKTVKQYNYDALSELANLFVLQLMVTTNNYQFLTRLKSAPHLSAFRVHFLDGAPTDFSFLKQYKQLSFLSVRYSGALNEIPKPFDISLLKDMHNLMWLYLFPNSDTVTHLRALSQLPELSYLELYFSEDGKNNVNVSDFSTLNKLTVLRVAGVNIDDSLATHFPNLSDFSIYTAGIPLIDFDYLRGLPNLRFLDVYGPPQPVTNYNNKTYDVLGTMKNMSYIRLLVPHSRSMAWLSGMKYLEHANLDGRLNSTKTILPELVSAYQEKGGVSSPLFSKLLYLRQYKDSFYHYDINSGIFHEIAENCKKGGAICNQSFWDRYAPPGQDTGPDTGGFDLCGNPIRPSDVQENEDVLFLNKKNVGVGVGELESDDESLTCSRVSGGLIYNCLSSTKKTDDEKWNTSYAPMQDNTKDIIYTW